MSELSPSSQDVRHGATYGAAAYILWGLFPLYFHLLTPSGAWEILTHRILWTLLLCAVVLVVRRDLAGHGRSSSHAADARGDHRRRPADRGELGHLRRRRGLAPRHRGLPRLLPNPLVTVAIGVGVLHERLRSLQWAAVAVGVVGGCYHAGLI